jgi:hypothetical protein
VQPDTKPDQGPPPHDDFADCMLGLNGPFGTQQTAVKASADGSVRVWIALDTRDNLGTSGTYGWEVQRLAVEREGKTECFITFPVGSTNPYTGSRHNCMDRLVVTGGGGVRYELEAPSTGPEQASTVISAFMGGTRIWGPYTLVTTKCAQETATTTLSMCRSGGPCQ